MEMKDVEMKDVEMKDMEMQDVEIKKRNQGITDSATAEMFTVKLEQVRAVDKELKKFKKSLAAHGIQKVLDATEETSTYVPDECMFGYDIHKIELDDPRGFLVRSYLNEARLLELLTHGFAVPGKLRSYSTLIQDWSVKANEAIETDARMYWREVEKIRASFVYKSTKLGWHAPLSTSNSCLISIFVKKHNVPGSFVDAFPMIHKWRLSQPVVEYNNPTHYDFESPPSDSVLHTTTGSGVTTPVDVRNSKKRMMCDNSKKRMMCDNTVGVCVKKLKTLACNDG
jgi:hypothetical protein